MPNGRRDRMVERAEQVGLLGDNEVVDEGSKNAFCQELDQAMQDEANAQGEYAKLESSAREAGMEEVAETIGMIEEQESTHEKRFKSMKENQCREV